MILNEIFSDFLKLLVKHNVKYVLVGGWAVIFEGYSRTTGDMDILIEPTVFRKLLVIVNYILTKIWKFDVFI